MELNGIPIYGIDKELFEKQALKYDLTLEKSIRAWMVRELDMVGDLSTARRIETASSLVGAVSDGVILARLANSFFPRSCQVFESSMPFHQMENINAFLKVAQEKLRIPSHSLFQTVDLFEMKNPSQVLIGLAAFMDAIETGSHAMRTKKQDTFKPDYNTPTLQSGYYAAKNAQKIGATASGVCYGMSRPILDTRVDKPADQTTPTYQSGHQAAIHAKKLGATAQGISFGQRRQIL